ncbi:MAG: hypothetical protein A2X48_18255 [Lentisphaerae bacterium GWF2_49_21]|nr:MAG: hypothetical protein A2X48_18255 [Lentisphaerae bacterium GWF2_49_21]
MNKISIGAGDGWHKEGWDSLDNAPASFKHPGQHFGTAWNSRLSHSHYDIVFCANMLEHVPTSKVEKVFAEFNRIMKIGGFIRVTMPDLKKAAEAYVKNDKEYFSKGQIHKSDHLGIGSMFLNIMISPGHDTVLMSRDFNEVLGGYGHVTSYDFEMLKTYFEKWGFGEVRQTGFCMSANEELRERQRISANGKYYPVDDENAQKEMSNCPQECFITGFDNQPEHSLYVEARKTKEIPYSIDLEFDYNKRYKCDDIVTRIKLSVMRISCHIIDLCLVKSGLLSLARKIRGR